MAFKFAREAHKGQTRRDGVRSYFDGHLVTVRDILASVTQNEDLLSASLLHDYLEDVPRAQASDLDPFGQVIKELVIELTDEFTKARHPALNRATRKGLERERYARMSGGAQLIKMADIAANLSDLDESDKGFARMFIKEKALCLPYLEPREGTLLYGERLELFAHAQIRLEQAKRTFDVR